MSVRDETESSQAASTRQQPPPTADAIPDFVPATTAGMPPTAQAFFAVVNSNGSLARGFQAVSSARITTGQYQVLFSHDLTGSAFVASIGDPGSLVIPPGGEISVVGRLGAANGVFIATRDSAGNLADRGFHLTVHS
jgi:hypothetical protein